MQNQGGAFEKQLYLYSKRNFPGNIDETNPAATVFSPLSSLSFVRNYALLCNEKIMHLFQPLRDPLGNNVLFPLNMLRSSYRNYDELSQVVTAPTYLIKEKDSRLYFFRLISVDINMLVEARFIESEFVVSACIENPTIEYISGLLKKGALLSFLKTGF